MIITGGTGNGYSAKVTSENKLATYSVTETELMHVSEEEEDAYIITTPFLTITTTGGRILWIRNDATDKVLMIERLSVSWDGGSASHDETVQLEMYGGDALPSANETAVTPVNLNTGSGKVAETTAYYWDEVGNGMTSSGGTVIGRSQAAIGTLKHNTGGLILTYNQAMSINLKADDEVGEASIIVVCYYHQ